MTFPLTDPDHIAARDLAASLNARKVRPWTFKAAQWSDRQRQVCSRNALQHDARGGAVRLASAYAAAMLRLCGAIMRDAHSHDRWQSAKRDFRSARSAVTLWHG